MSHSYNKALHISIGRIPFQVGLGFQPLCLIDVVMSHATNKKNLHMCILRLIKKPSLLNKSNTFVSKFTTYWRIPAPSTSNGMINIGCHISFRWVTKFGCICRKNSLSKPIGRYDHSNIGLTPSRRLWVRTLSISTFPHSLAYNQRSLWTVFGHAFHHC